MNSLPSQVGKAGEFFVCYYLTLYYGIECVLVDREDDDIWIKTPNRRIRTLQVKTTLSPVIKRSGPRYYFNANNSKTADFFVLFAADRQCFLLKRTQNIKQKFITLPSWSFTKVNMHRSIRTSLNV